MTNFESWVQGAEDQLDSVVTKGTDEELFIAGYLHGHFSLAVSVILRSPTPSVEQLDEVLRLNLDAAFENQELDEHDQQKVFALWTQLLTK